MQIDCNKLFLLLEVDNSVDEQDYDEGNRITASDLFRAATEPLHRHCHGLQSRRPRAASLRCILSPACSIIAMASAFGISSLLSPYAASIQTLRIVLAPCSNAGLS